MRVTVCELEDSAAGLAHAWDALVDHVRTQKSELVLLPEMPFAPWFAVSRVFEERIWRDAVETHTAWLEHLGELSPAVVLGTRPVDRGAQRLNEAFCWTEETGYRPAHYKCFLPNEEGFWEAEWYSQGDGSFAPIQCGAARVGFQICTELWALDQARTYGKQGVHIIATPRATPHSTLPKWVVGGQAAAICSGAFAISSNHMSSPGDPVHLGGQGWIVSPDGELLAITSRDQPIASADLHLTAAERAKRTYPRYVF